MRLISIVLISVMSSGSYGAERQSDVHVHGVNYAQVIFAGKTL